MATAAGRTRHPIKPTARLTVGKSILRSRELGVFVALVFLSLLGVLACVATRVSSLATGPELILTGSDEVTALSFTPDGRKLAVGDVRGQVRLWDADTGLEEPFSHAGHSDVVWAIAFSRDGRLLVSGSRDGTLRRHDIASGKAEELVRGGCLHGADLSPDGRTLAVAASGTVEIWDLQTRAARTLLWEETCPPGMPVAFSPRGDMVAIASTAGTVGLWDPVTGTERGRLPAHALPVLAVAWSPDGSHLASASLDGVAKIWRTDARECCATLAGHDGAVYAVAFSPCGRMVATAGYDEVVRLWDVATATELASFRGHTNVVYRVAFSPDGLRLASAGSDRTVRLWRVPAH